MQEIPDSTLRQDSFDDSKLPLTLTQPHEFFEQDSFMVPALDENIQRSAHKHGDPPALFPSDSDSFLIVRRFLYITLTNSEWGITMLCPGAIRATVEGWYGNGYYLRHRYEKGTLEDICPLDAISTFEKDPERVCDLVATCVIHACRMHFDQRKEQKKAVRTKAITEPTAGFQKDGGSREHTMYDTASDTNDGGETYEEDDWTTSQRARRYGRSYFPEEWIAQPRRSSSIYSRTSNGMSLQASAASRLQDVQTKSATNHARDETSLEHESAEGSASGLSDAKQCKGTQSESSAAAVSNCGNEVAPKALKPITIEDTVSSKSRTRYPKKVRLASKSVTDLLSLVRTNIPHPTASHETERSYEIKTVRFEDTIEGPAPATVESEAKRKEHPTNLLSVTKISDKRGSLSHGSSESMRPVSLVSEGMPGLRAKTPVVGEYDVRYVEPALAGPLETARKQEASRARNNLAKRKTWHLGDGLDIAMSVPQAISCSNPVHPLPSVSSLDLDEGAEDQEKGKAVEHDDESNRDDLFPQPPRKLTIKEFFRSEEINVSQRQQPSVVSTSPPGQSSGAMSIPVTLSNGHRSSPVIIDSLQNIQSSMRGATTEPVITVTELEGPDAITPAPPLQRATTTTHSSRGRVEFTADSEHIKVVDLRPKETGGKSSLPRRFGRGFVKVLKPLKPARFR